MEQENGELSSFESVEDYELATGNVLNKDCIHGVMHWINLVEMGFLRLRQVLQLYPVSRSSWYAGIKEGIYPAPIKINSRTSVWRVTDIKALLRRTEAEHAG